MSGSSRAFISGAGWMLMLDSGMSISWSNPAHGAAKHRAQEAAFLLKLEQARSSVVALLERHPNVELGDVDAPAVALGARDLPSKLEVPCIIEVRASDVQIWTWRLAVRNTTRPALTKLVAEARPLIKGLAKGRPSPS
jgi:hypothetical protein